MAFLKDMQSGFRNLGKKAVKAVKGKSPAPAKPKPAAKEKITRQTVQKQNMANSARLIEDYKGKSANRAIRITAAGGEVPKTKQYDKPTSFIGKTFKTLEKTSNAGLTGFNYFQTGRNAVDGLVKGFNQSEKTTGTDIIDNNKYLTAAIEKPIKYFEKDSAKAAKKIKNTKAVAGFGLEVGLDPASYVNLGLGGALKGAVTGIGGTVAKETAESGAKIVGKQLLRSTKGAGLNADDFLKAVKHVPEDKKVAVIKKLSAQIKAGGASHSHIDDITRLATKSYDDMASSVAKKTGFDMNKMLSAKAGSGITVGKKTIASGGAMRDFGASLNRAVLKDGSTGRKVNDAFVEAVRKGYKSGMTGDQYHLTRAIDSAARGFSAQGFDKTLKGISSVAKGVSDTDSNAVRNMLETGDIPKNVTASQQKLYNMLKSTQGDLASREVSTGLLSEKSLRKNYMPRVKNMNLPELDDGVWSVSGAKRKASALNPKLGSSKSRVINTDSVTKANKVLRESYTELDGKDFFETNPAKAFAQRAKDHFDKVGQKFRADDTLDAMGKKLSLGDLNELSINEAHIKKLITNKASTTAVQKSSLMQLPVNKAGATLADLMAESASKGVRVSELHKANGMLGDPAALEALSSMIEGAGDDIITNLSPKQLKGIASVMQTNLPKGADIPVRLLPKAVVNSLTEKAMKPDNLAMRGVLKGVDKMHGFWKPLKTSLNVPYYPKNVQGGVANTVMDVGLGKTITSIPATAKILSGADNAAVKLGGRSYKVGQLKDIMEATNVTSSNFARADLKTVGRHIDDATRGGGFFRHPIKSIMDAGSKATDATEQAIRTHELVANMRKGFDPVTSAERVKMHQFDYGDLTEFEKSFMKRVMPFYTYKSKNVPTQLGKFFDNPVHHTRMLDKLPKLAADMAGVDYESKPEYLKEQAPIFTGRNELGMPRYMASSLPQADIYSAPLVSHPKSQFYDAVGMLTPLVKSAAEYGFDMRMLPQGNVVKNNDEKNPAYMFGKQVPNKVANLADTINPTPAFNYLDPENLRGKVTQPVPSSFGLLKDFDEISNSKFDYYDRYDELGGVIDALKRAGVPVPESVDKIIGRKNSKKYKQGGAAKKAPYIQNEQIGKDFLNPVREDFASDSDYNKMMNTLGALPQEQELMASDAFKYRQSPQEISEFIKSLVGIRGK